MVITEFYRARKDGVNLVRSIDAIVDKDGKPLRDEDGNLIPTGYKIQKVGTDEVYTEAIDVENGGFEYTETDIPIESE